MTWKDLTDAAEIPAGTNRTIAGVTVFNDHGRFYACETRCPHMGHPMSKGTIRDGVITCAWHRWDFDLAHGGCYRGGTDDLQVYPLKIENGRVWVDRTLLAADLEVRARRLHESLLNGDPYLQAKELARMLAAGAPVSRVLAIVAEHLFNHSIAAHQNAQATSELQALLDATALSAYVPEADQMQALMLGVRSIGSSTRERPLVEPLPGTSDPERLVALFTTYVRDSSPLGLERILLTLSADAPALERCVLTAATKPFLIDRPAILPTVATWLEVGSVVGASFDAHRHAVLAWSLGESRATPDPDAREAMDWLEASTERLADPALANGSHAITTAAVAGLLDEPHIGAVFARLMTWLSDGVGCTALLDALSLTFARRCARLLPGNGGLWDSAAEGIGLCQAARQVGVRAGGAYRVPILFMVVFHLHRTRWLPSPTPYEGKLTVKGNWTTYEAAFEALDAKQARDLAIAALAGESDRAAAVGRWLAPMMREDLQPSQLRLLAAMIDEMSHQAEWQPYLAGAIGWLLDDKNARTVQAATRFGQSFA